MTKEKELMLKAISLAGYFTVNEKKHADKHIWNFRYWKVLLKWSEVEAHF